MISKHWNTDGRSVSIIKETMLINQAHLVTFHVSILLNLWTFQPTLIYLDCKSSSPSSSYVDGIGSPDSLAINLFWQVLLTISSVCIELMTVSFCWLTNTGVSICRSPPENVAYEFILTSLVVPSTFCSFYLSGLWDGRQVAIQLLFYRVLLSGFVQNSTQHFCVDLI